MLISAHHAHRDFHPAQHISFARVSRDRCAGGSDLAPRVSERDPCVAPPSIPPGVQQSTDPSGSPVVELHLPVGPRETHRCWGMWRGPIKMVGCRGARAASPLLLEHARHHQPPVPRVPRPDEVLRPNTRDLSFKGSK